MKVCHLLAVGAIAIGGCGADERAAAPKPAAPKPDAPEPESVNPDKLATTDPGGPYVGSWTARLSPAQAEYLGVPEMAGTFKLTLRSDGSYTTFQAMDGPSEGRYRAAAGHRLVFGKDRACSMGHVPGKGLYSWEITGGALVLKGLSPETGGCTGRTQSLTYPPKWQRR